MKKISELFLNKSIEESIELSIDISKDSESDNYSTHISNAGSSGVLYNRTNSIEDVKEAVADYLESNF